MHITKGSKLPPVKELSTYALDVEPKDYDWSEGYPDAWDFYERDECYQCGKVSDETGSCRTEGCPNEDDRLDSCEGPMMNYFYALPEQPDIEEATLALVRLPLCIVSFDGPSWHIEDDWALALTGGGMDLSWEICEAFMRLGYLPPVHFGRLPGMVGRGTSRRDRWIIAGCRRALIEHRAQIVARDDSALAELASLSKRAREYAAEREK